MRFSRSLFAVLAVVVVAAGVSGQQGEISTGDRALYKQMLADIRRDLKDWYYDPAFRGQDLNALVEDAGAQLAKASTTAEAVDIIVNVLERFGDSHTSFVPPIRSTRVKYGWTMGAVGEDPLVLSVDAESDAARAGLAPGDRVLRVNRFQPTRDSLRKIVHYYRVVRPQAQQQLVVRKPDGTEKTLLVNSSTERRPTVQLIDAIRESIVEGMERQDQVLAAGKGIVVWRMNAFRFPEDMSASVGKVREAKGLVLDLRGNGGGYVEGLKAVVGWTFDREIHVTTEISRKGTKKEIAKPKGRPYLGKLVVLVDSRSASAAECYARVVQLEKRGTVLGDRTSGQVMTSELSVHDFGLGHQVYYGVSVTVADTKMSNGERLEGTGVTPDELILPTAADLAAGRDPVLARAVSLLGGTLTPAEAGALPPLK